MVSTDNHSAAVVEAPEEDSVAFSSGRFFALNASLIDFSSRNF
jgi:hypothetical protein